ncbi:alpha/beta hydrolase family protein [Fictibacillus fluitans]|uniref:Alpha/beta fold hydrolase n=1 Tax=Fictibacillus fluitans TaxID=3058422 RepID=A0ABT8I0L2_9BACL|nr:alpha/beta fold hydrolase [Fictibacillus sp. NE201]MDN4526067.1 alpha/beta fold hydrolase [Fictibacillus sp. NE201]
MEKQGYFLWKDYKLTATVHYPRHTLGIPQAKLPIVIICHGFTSNRIGVDRLFVKTAQQLTSSQFAVLRFDYAGCGESEGSYGENTFQDLISQTQAAIDYATKLPCIDSREIILLGHSLGGAVAVHTATINPRVKDLILWASVGNPYEDIVNIVGKNECKCLPEKGYVDHLGYSLKADFLQSLQAYHPIKELSRFTGDVLLLHGTEDKDIPSRYCSHFSDSARTRSRGDTQLQLIKGANHTFSSIHHFNDLLAQTLNWLNRQSLSERITI